MEAAVEEVAAPPGQNKDLSPIAKGKRTKRHRPHSPIPFTIKPPTTSATASGSPTTSSEESTTTEDEDTARCLILLARGHFFTDPPPDSYHDDHQHSKNSNTSKRSYTAVNPPTPKSAAGGGASAPMYTCKTCNRAFHSFQALGGHRASHKKPKNEKKSSYLFDEEDFPSPSISSSRNRTPNSLSIQISNISSTTFSAGPKSSPSPRIHECSYCGAEFTSGQALGGHMRRHRATPISPSSYTPPPVTSAAVAKTEREDSKEQKNGLSLDLNLPAPEDENQRIGLSGSRQRQRSPEERQQQQQNEAAARHVLSTTTSNAAPASISGRPLLIS